jgi:hypothetical protein
MPKKVCVNDTDGDGDCAACAHNPDAPCRQATKVYLIDEETLEQIRGVLVFVSPGRSHVRVFWHTAPDATARVALGALIDIEPHVCADECTKEHDYSGEVQFET